jgi:penicillin-binding protein 2
MQLLSNPKPKTTKFQSPTTAKKKKQQTERTVGVKHQSIFIILLMSLFLLGGVGSRLAFLQLIQGEKYHEKAENNRTRVVPKPPVRGNLYDRKGRVIAATRLSHSAYLWPRIQKQENWLQIRQILANILQISETELQEKVGQEAYDSPTLIRIARDLTPAQITAIEEHRNQLTGVEVDVDTVRHYPYGDLASNVIGYTREIDADELQRRKDEGYRMGDIVGKMGAESGFESRLRGEWGGIMVEVDGAGRAQRLLGVKQAKAGQDVTLSLDVDLQKAAEAVLGERKGAIVALDPRDGKVLAMASYPRFDPNIFSKRVTPEIWKKVQGKGNPLLNRALRGFPPASTFKVVTATAGMESGKYPPNTILPTYAYLYVGGTAFGEWNRAGFGPMGYVRAMAWSSNTFHGQIGRGVGGETLIKWARNYGFGSTTGIELPEDYGGLIADDAWKRKRFNWEWTQGDTVNMSIGQGFTLATPLQIAVMFAVPANGGYRVIPHLDHNNKEYLQQRQSLNLKPTTIKTLKEGLRAVITGGTGGSVNSPIIPTPAGKSGTAEAPPGESHTWFGAFAPYDNPEIVVVAFAEHSGGGGGSVAGPMVRQVMETYFKLKR